MPWQKDHLEWYIIKKEQLNINLEKRIKFFLKLHSIKKIPI